MSKYTLVLVSVVLALFMVGPALAQDTTPPAVEPLPVISVEEAGAMLQQFLTALIGSAVLTAPLTTFIVSIVKRLDRNQVVTGEGWALIVGGLLTVAVWLSRQFGVEVQLNNVFQLVQFAGPLVVTLFTTLFGAAVYYQAAKVSRTPIAGYTRPELPAKAA